MEEKNLDTTVKEEPALRPWVTPAFERLPLGEALGSAHHSQAPPDGSGGYS